MPALALVTFYKLLEELGIFKRLDRIWALRELFPHLLDPAGMGNGATQHGQTGSTWAPWVSATALNCSGIICSPGTDYSLISIMTGADLRWTMKLLHSTQCHLHTFEEQCSWWVSSLSKEQRETLDFITPWISLLLGAAKMQISEYSDAKC